MDQLRAFAEKTNIPVALTLLGLGSFPAGHPLCLGMMGMHASRGPTALFQEATCSSPLACVSMTRYRQPQELRPERAQDPHRNRPLRGQQERKGRRGLKSATCAKRSKSSSRTSATDDHAGWIETHPENERRGASPRRAKLPDVGQAVRRARNQRLWRYTNGDALVRHRRGQHQMWTGSITGWKNAQFITSGGLGTMGFGLPAAIGAPRSPARTKTFGLFAATAASR